MRWQVSSSTSPSTADFIVTNSSCSFPCSYSCSSSGSSCCCKYYCLACKAGCWFYSCSIIVRYEVGPQHCTEGYLSSRSMTDPSCYSTGSEAYFQGSSCSVAAYCFTTSVASAVHCYSWSECWARSCCSHRRWCLHGEWPLTRQVGRKARAQSLRCPLSSKKAHSCCD